MSRCQGQWNAYVLQGASREERAQRLSEVPEAWRDLVADHVRTAYAVRENARRAKGRRGGFSTPTAITANQQRNR